MGKGCVWEERWGWEEGVRFRSITEWGNRGKGNKGRGEGKGSRYSGAERGSKRKRSKARGEGKGGEWSRAERGRGSG